MAALKLTKQKSSSDSNTISDHHQCCLICESPNLKALDDYHLVKLVRCSNCGLVFSPRVPSQQELKEHYEGYSRDTSYSSPINQKRIRELLDSFKKYRSTNRLLDVGSGVGSLLTQAREEAGWKTFGVEMTEEALRICKQRGHSMQRGPLDSRKYEPNSFDIVIYSEVIEHINNQLEEFSNVYKLLRPGGIIYITTPNFHSLSRRLLGDRWNVIQYPEHLAYFTPSTLQKLMSDTGFETVSVRTTGISPGRLKNSLFPSLKRQSKQDSVNEQLRVQLETKTWLKILKSLVNTVLDKTQTGDTIKAIFQKPRR